MRKNKRTNHSPMRKIHSKTRLRQVAYSSLINEWKENIENKRFFLFSSAPLYDFFFHLEEYSLFCYPLHLMDEDNHDHAKYNKKFDATMKFETVNMSSDTKNRCRSSFTVEDALAFHFTYCERSLVSSIT